jgi:predicted amidohydrolase
MLTLVESAVEAGAHLVVFPEYTGLLPASLIPFSKSLLRWASGGEKNFRSGLTALDGARAAALAEAFHHFFYEAYLYTFSTIARRQHVYIVAGTCFFTNRESFTTAVSYSAPTGSPPAFRI